nr:asparaginase [uncultured Shinella sp.]
MKPKIKIIGLGGTIASSSQRTASGVVPTLTAADLISAIPALSDIADIEAENFANVPSTEITLSLLLNLAATIRKLEIEKYSGVVITQGTDTIEETAYVLNLLLDCDFPVVVTGAMRNPTLPGADGPANLAAAVACATSIHCRNQGVLVVSDDTIHAADWVQKRDTSSTSAFWSPSPLGWISEGIPAIRARVPRRPAITLPEAGQPPFVPIIRPALWDDDRLLNAALAQGASGIILDLSGGGHVASGLVPSIAEAAGRLPVVFASRTRGGRVLSATYGQKGAEIDLINRGCIPAVDLDALKARLLLLLLLLAGRSEQFTDYCQLSFK